MKEIQITVNPGKNFTPAGLMKRYADQSADVQFSRGYWGNAHLTIEGRTYEYHHYGITRETGVDIVTLFLQEVEVKTRINPMCYDCTKLNKGCKGSTCQTWTGCAMKERAEA